ncbi:MAG: hypothetical protein IJ608_07710 [Lachnospiraceae bacterium]|nr:hypothetical protein [Lachnospiraceae bacterium]
MDENELINMIESQMSGGVSRLKVGFTDDVVDGGMRKEYHHGRCDVGSPWAKGTVTNCDEVDEGRELEYIAGKERDNK